MNPFHLFHRWLAIRHAKSIVRQYIAAACKGDPVASQQVSRASHYLSLFNL